MKRILYALLLLALLATLLPFSGAVSAAGPQWVVVNWGDTLYSIAARYGTTVGALMQANRLPNQNFVYAGQRLFIPAGSSAPSSPGQPRLATAGNGAYYTVRAGDTLYSIASRNGTSVQALAQANGLWNYDFIYSGQRLQIPGASPAPPANPPPAASAPPAANPAPTAVPPLALLPATPAAAPSAALSGAKWIDVNLRNETITAYQGSTALKTVLVSTGVAAHPTVVGRYAIYSKYAAFTMSGGTPGVDYYYLPNVPWTMFFYSGYAIHGTYWHHNFGHPMSHGCVNLTIPDAKWFYDWAPIGTPVVTHW